MIEILSEIFDLGIKEYFEKESSTAFSRWLAESKYKSTPKELAKKLYERAKEISGKEGRDAFRQSKGINLSGNRSSISRRDPLNLRPDLKSPKPQSAGLEENYITNILQHKNSLKPKNPARARGTIAHSPDLKNHEDRLYHVRREGVGHPDSPTPQEMKKVRENASVKFEQSDKRKDYKTGYNVSYADRHKDLSKKYYQQDPEKIKERWLKEKWNNIDQIREKQRLAAQAIREENPEMSLEAQRHMALIKKLKKLYGENK